MIVSQGPDVQNCPVPKTKKKRRNNFEPLLLARVLHYAGRHRDLLFLRLGRYKRSLIRPFCVALHKFTVVCNL